MSKAVVFFANGTEECEALLAVDLLRRAKVEVVTAAAGECAHVVTSHGIAMDTDTTAQALNTADVDMIVLPGGIPGTPNLAADPDVVRIATEFMQADKKVAAHLRCAVHFGRAGTAERPSRHRTRALPRQTHGRCGGG